MNPTLTRRKPAVVRHNPAWVCAYQPSNLGTRQAQQYNFNPATTSFDIDEKCRQPVKIYNLCTRSIQTCWEPKAHFTLIVHSLAIYFTHVDSQWEYDIDAATTWYHRRKIAQTLLQRLNVHSLATHKRPIASEETISVHDAFKVLRAWRTLYTHCTFTGYPQNADSQWRDNLCTRSIQSAESMKDTLHSCRPTFTGYP